MLDSAPDRSLAASLEDALDATRVADHTPGIGRLPATRPACSCIPWEEKRSLGRHTDGWLTCAKCKGRLGASPNLVANRVDKPATLRHPSPDAGTNELYTDLAEMPVEDAMMVLGPIPPTPPRAAMESLLNRAIGEAVKPAPIPIKGGRPVARRDPAEHGSRSLPSPQADARLRMVQMSVVVPILVGDIDDPAKVLGMAVGRVRQQIPDVMIEVTEPMFIDDVGATIPQAMSDEEGRISEVILRAAAEINESCESKTEVKTQRMTREYRETVDDAWSDAKGGGR